MTYKTYLRQPFNLNHSTLTNSSDLSLSSQSLENLTRDNTVRNSTLQSELNGNFWRLVPINIDSVDDKIIQY
jgi:hypothetical protein